MRYSFYCFLCIMLSGTAVFGQQGNKTDNKDSIPAKYLYNRAHGVSYFSDKWQNSLDSALAIHPDNAEWWQQKAMPYFKCRKYEVGMKFLDKAVTLNPKEYLSYRGFINCIFAKRFNDAIADFANAEKLNGNKTEMEHPYSFYIALSYLQLNKFDSALLYLNRTVANESPESGTNIVHFMDWFYLGIVNYEMKNYTTAIDYFDKALLKYGHFSEAKFYKAVCLHRLMIKNKEAAQLFEEAKADLKNGYTFTEDNCVYEKYPYQLSNYVAEYHGMGM